MESSAAATTAAPAHAVASAACCSEPAACKGTSAPRRGLWKPDEKENGAGLGIATSAVLRMRHADPQALRLKHLPTLLQAESVEGISEQFRRKAVVL